MAEKKKKDKGIHIDLGLGGIFEGIEKLVDLASELKDLEGNGINKEGEINLDGLKKGMKGVYGFTVKSAIGGKPVVQSFGNIKKNTEKGTTDIDEIREPITDVFDEENKICIIMEMPGISKKDIKIELKGDILEVSAETDRKKYSKEVLLKEKNLKIDNLSYQYKNGILEINLKK